MKIRSTQASPRWSLIILLHEFNQVNNTLSVRNVSFGFLLSLFTGKPRSKYRSIFIQIVITEKQSPCSTRPSYAFFYFVLQNSTNILEHQTILSWWSLAFCPFFGIHYTAKIICKPFNGIPQLLLLEGRIKTTEIWAYCPSLPNPADMLLKADNGDDRAMVHSAIIIKVLIETF